jgi:FkbM family methyltransferase
MQNQFYYYNSCFDPIELINKYKSNNLKSSPEHLVNFLGLKIAPEYMPECFRNQIGTIEPPPIPANWHADISEFGAVLRAVDLLTENRFVMGEMGCGWGCWMGISGLVAKKKGLDVKLYGIEGDKKHISWAKENMVNNGFSEKEYAICEGLASATLGKALFPLVDKETIHYGLEPIFNASDLEIQKALKIKSHEILPMVPLEKIFNGESRVDLLHIDIQGGEVDLISGSINYLSKHVAYIVIGTHSRSIEGKLIDVLLKNGWKLEIERPAIFHIKQRKLVTAVDGVQGWRNPELLPEPQRINPELLPEPKKTNVLFGNKILRTISEIFKTRDERLSDQKLITQKNMIIPTHNNSIPDQARSINWFHQIRLGEDFVTEGPDKSEEKSKYLNLPEQLTDKSVIDIGCWDGFFSFECEKRGAGRVLSTDHFVWSKIGTKDAGYNFAHSVLKSRAVKLQCSIEELDPNTLGQFDLVLMLGVLYHAPDPLGYLRKARSLCSGVLILESHVDMLDYPRPAIAYYEGASLCNDPTNFWGPNTSAVVGMLKDSGFKHVEPQPVFWKTRQAFHAYI